MTSEEIALTRARRAMDAALIRNALAERTSLAALVRAGRGVPHDPACASRPGAAIHWSKQAREVITPKRGDDTERCGYRIQRTKNILTDQEHVRVSKGAWFSYWRATDFDALSDDIDDEVFTAVMRQQQKSHALEHLSAIYRELGEAAAEQELAKLRDDGSLPEDASVDYKAYAAIGT